MTSGPSFACRLRMNSPSWTGEMAGHQRGRNPLPPGNWLRSHASDPPRLSSPHHKLVKPRLVANSRSLVGRIGNRARLPQGLGDARTAASIALRTATSTISLVILPNDYLRGRVLDQYRVNAEFSVFRRHSATSFIWKGRSSGSRSRLSNSVISWAVLGFLILFNARETCSSRRREFGIFRIFQSQLLKMILADSQQDPRSAWFGEE